VSRIGKNPVPIPAGVSVARSGNTLTVTGPKGRLALAVHPAMTVEIGAESVTVTRPSDEKAHRALHGTTRAHLQNLVLGVTKGFSRNLELVGVGYRAELRGDKLLLVLGHSHPIAFVPPAGIAVAVNSATSLTVSGIDKQLVGQVAAKIRALRPPEPYKGKGVKYEGEYIRRKAGKTAKS
jgi:large subunit ribosomal protein L6